MDERLRHLERASRAGDPEAATLLQAALQRSGRPAPTLSIEERVRLGLFDTFTVFDEAVTWTALEERPKALPALEGLAFVFRRADYEAALRDPPP